MCIRDRCFGKDTNLRKELLLDAESTGAIAADEAPAKKAATKGTQKATPKATKTTAKAKPVQKATKKKK